jgi:hypothetical protein
MWESTQIYQLGIEEFTQPNKHKTTPPATMIPAQTPGTRFPSKHVVRVQSKLALPAFIQDPPEGSVAEQFPIVSALRSNSDASQLAKMWRCG